MVCEGQLLENGLLGGATLTLQYALPSWGRGSPNCETSSGIAKNLPSMDWDSQHKPQHAPSLYKRGMESSAVYFIIAAMPSMSTGS